MRRVAWLTMIGLAVLVAGTTRAETIDPEWEVTTVTFEVHWYPTRIALQAALKRAGCDNCGTTMGISKCERTDDTAHCTILSVRPQRVDDKHTAILGHEVMHGLFGSYHEEWYLD